MSDKENTSASMSGFLPRNICTDRQTPRRIAVGIIVLWLLFGYYAFTNIRPRHAHRAPTAPVSLPDLEGTDLTFVQLQSQGAFADARSPSPNLFRAQEKAYD
jgi:hypothetical protein